MSCPCGLMRTWWHWPPCKKKSQQKEKKEPHLLARGMGRRGCVGAWVRARVPIVPPSPFVRAALDVRGRVCWGAQASAPIRAGGRADVSPRRRAARCVRGRRARKAAWGERACRARVWACAGGRVVCPCGRVVPVRSCACRRGAVACAPSWHWGLQTEELAKKRKKKLTIWGESASKERRWRRGAVDQQNRNKAKPII